MKNQTMTKQEKNVQRKENSKRWIVCAAVRNSKTGQIVCGPRHMDPIMQEQLKAFGLSFDWLHPKCQGFIDQYGVFLSREEALKLAHENGQFRLRCGGDEHRLYSENLY